MRSKKLIDDLIACATALSETDLDLEPVSLDSLLGMGRNEELAALSAAGVLDDLTETLADVAEKIKTALPNISNWELGELVSELLPDVGQ
jgi:hypothetical protein